MLNISDLSVTTRKYVYDVLNTKIFKVRTIVHVTDIGRQKSSTSKDKLFIGAKELTIKVNKKRQKETEAHRKLTDRKSYRQKNQEKVSNIAHIHLLILEHDYWVKTVDVKNVPNHHQMLYSIRG